MRKVPPGAVVIPSGPYQGFLESIEVRKPDPVRARQAIREAQTWRQSTDAAYSKFPANPRRLALKGDGQLTAEARRNAPPTTR